MSVKLELYKVFKEVAEAGNITAAASALFISQSAVSQSIKQLEAELQTRLFARNSRGVTLTPDGKMLYEYVRSAIGLLETGEEKLSQSRHLQMGHLTIGASDTVTSQFLLPFLDSFHRQYPAIHIQIISGRSHKVLGLLQSGKVDIAFASTPPESGSLEVYPCFATHSIFVAGADYDCDFDHIYTLEEISRFPLILLERKASSRLYLEKYFLQNGLKLHPEIELGARSLLVDLAAIGFGVAGAQRRSVYAAGRAADPRRAALFRLREGRARRALSPLAKATKQGAARPESFCFSPLFFPRKSGMISYITVPIIIMYTENQRSGEAMEKLKERIRTEGRVLPGNIIKVDGFLNHRVDTALMGELADEFAKYFDVKNITMVLTAEASGIALATVCAERYGVPMVFAKKAKSDNIEGGLYQSEIFSYTYKKKVTLIVAQEWIKPTDRVLIIDDFMANGYAMRGLIDIVNKAGAELAGIGVAMGNALPQVCACADMVTDTVENDGIAHALQKLKLIG